jgi:hypothetical protein
MAATAYAGDDFPESFHVKNWQPARMTVENSVHYEPTAEAANREWMAIIPEGEGFVRYNNGVHDRAFGLSTYHQLHCMNQIRRSTYMLPANIEHLHHCMNYIRQMVLCTPDLHLEPFVLHPDEAGDDGLNMMAVNGLGVTHTCKDWRQLFDAVEDYHNRWVKSREHE